MQPRLVLKQMEIGPMKNFVYLVGCAKTCQAAVVDPAWDIPFIRDTAQEMGLEIGHVFLTHGHPDHINGLLELVEATHARVHLHSLDALGPALQVAARQLNQARTNAESHARELLLALGLARVEVELKPRGGSLSSVPADQAVTRVLEFLSSRREELALKDTAGGE